MKVLVIILSILFLSGCREKELRISDYKSYLQDPSNGLIKTSQANGVKLTVKYLPSEYLALKESSDIGNKSRLVYDSLVKTYQNSLTFLLSIEPDKKKSSSDVMYKDLSNFEEYKSRAMELNFNIEQYIKLKTGDKIYYPVLSNLENTYSVGAGRSIYLVFADNKKVESERGDMEIIFEDQLFATGINHFLFKQKDIENLPSLVLGGLLK